MSAEQKIITVHTKKNRFSKLIVMMIIILNILFTCAVLYVFLKTGSEPMTLTGCWFAFTTGELWALSSISKTKMNKKDDDNGEII